MVTPQPGVLATEPAGPASHLSRALLRGHLRQRDASGYLFGGPLEWALGPCVTTWWGGATRVIVRQGDEALRLRQQEAVVMELPTEEADASVQLAVLPLSVLERDGVFELIPDELVRAWHTSEWADAVAVLAQRGEPGNG